MLTTGQTSTGSADCASRRSSSTRRPPSRSAIRVFELDVLRALPDDKRVGVGAVNPKHAVVEDVAAIAAHLRRAVQRLGRERVLVVPDCGFATFADNPVASAEVAEAKLVALARAAELVGR